MRWAHEWYVSGDRLSQARVVPTRLIDRGPPHCPEDVSKRLNIKRLECLGLIENRFLALG